MYIDLTLPSTDILISMHILICTKICIKQVQNKSAAPSVVHTDYCVQIF